MPPRSYLITAAILVVLVAASIPLTLGFSVIVWRWLFAVAACMLGIGGAFRVVQGLRAPRWIAAALAAPAFLWAMNTFKLMSYEPAHVAEIIMFSAAAQLALLAAAAGALALLERLSKPHAAYRWAYVLLAACAASTCLDFAAHGAGWGFTNNAYYAATVQALRLAASVVEYGSVIGTVLLLTMRRDAEFWASAAISLIALNMLYDTVRLLFVVELRGDTTFWLQPVLMLIGGAAVWRIGALLNAQTGWEEPAPG